ncbi:DUF481 domain-containing protein [Phycisphaera mikurensis]|uniref:DUF481 domain-containing protein n=1 Tax=Phycisphaera mikurensis (strain NBRC 102666 / KCTC 22515 / FYK2301M01) TaxID=1142394 RepID=I0IGJ1_PHYMF|nr:DUF481 domain-containing protein [Phycisphaera mikurensis]MBB6442939.1 putative salt-induced outer membrane protein YdiY [Phycisphaera mikurensis]BAM04379.1 hypothetical protein PSMK_22200 [Phycisphaera mikurensis NBRC 102666]
MKNLSGRPLPSPPSLALLIAAGLAPAAAANAQVELANGDTLDAAVVPTDGVDEEGNPVVTLDHPSLGLITVPASAVAPEDRGVSGASGTAAEAANAMTEVIDSVLFPGWDKTLSAGFNGRTGNTETLSFYGAFRTGIEDERRRWDVKADYFRATEDGEATESNLIFRADRDWLVPGEDYFYFARGTAEYDQFEAWEQRLGLYGGVGYQFLDDDRHSLLGRVGVGAIYEFGGNEDFTVEGLIGIEYAYQITENQSIELRNTTYPALDPFFAEFRNVTELNYKVQIAAGDGLSLKLGVYNEYESEVDDGLDNNDFKYFGALVYDF